ncbi:MAG: HEAT repeat domain-containing protein [Planctomycetes bacterium]|nr:HEAT repeat domain-containing protein [Planctomycetota bacterium]
MSRTLLAAALIGLLAPAPLFAHGGQYQRPQHLGPMTGVLPEDAGRFGAGTGQPGAYPYTPGGPLARKKRPLLEDEEWLAWWRLNGSALIAARAREEAGGSRAMLSARARGAAADWTPVQEVFSEALRAAAPDVVDSALVACGRSATPEGAEALFPQVWPLVAHPDESVRRSALLALGLLGSPRSAPVLLSFLNNTGRTDATTNSVAAIALGYLSEPRAIGELKRAVTRGEQEGLAAAAIVALGLFQQDRREILVFLLERLAEAPRPEIPIALGRLGAEAQVALPVLREAAAASGRDHPLRRSCIIALGALSPCDDAASVQALIRIATISPDAPSRGLALIALGRIAGRADPAPSGESTAREARDFLRRSISGARYRRDAPWACLAAALAFEPCGVQERTACAQALLSYLRGDTRDKKRGAAALALGLLGAGEAIPEVRTLFEEARDSDLRGSAALALGLLRDRGSVYALEDLLLYAADPEMREQAAAALALLAPEQAAAALLAQYERAGTAAEAVLAAQLLARVAGPSAIPPLVRAARDQERDSLARAFALVALGRIVERSSLPWNARLALDSNFLSLCPAEELLLDIF